MNLQKNIRLGLIIGLLILVNLIFSSFFFRIDLTEEKRYSLSDVSREVLDTLAYPMLVTVYMEGEFPPDIRAFQDALRTTLLEMKQYSNYRLEFEFVDPSNNSELLNLFQKAGFTPIPVTFQKSVAEQSRTFMWPLARFSYRQYEQYLDLLKGCSIPTPQGITVDFIKAEADLEYKLMSVIMNLSKERRGIVGLLRGHGEWGNEAIGELGQELQASYNLVDYNMKTQYAGAGISPDIDVLLILQPTEPFSERDKYEIDQYIMRGGNVLFVMDQEYVDLDMYQKVSAVSDYIDLNLDDMLMKYGIKLNFNLIQDASCESTELFDTESKTFTSEKWLFYPMLYQFPEHPVTRNVDAVLMRYASSIDTFSQPDVKKSIFLASSPYSRTLAGRQFIDINQYVLEPPPASVFNKGSQIMGLMMEGRFESVFNNRKAPTDSLAPNPPTAVFGPKNHPDHPSRIALISDGEFVLGNQFRGERQAMPYDNKSLIMNVVDYLSGAEALTQIRSKDVVIRRLSKEKVLRNGSSLRYLNLLLPIALIAVFGVLRAYMRRKRNENLRQEV